jgi:hypothetical protein
MITSLLKATDADDVGRYLYEHVIPKLPSADVERFSAVADALSALSSETDAIITSKRVEIRIADIPGELECS